MARGIIYIMTTIVPGLIKIGKTGSENYSSRMYNLEHNGYCNVTGLKRAFAIEVDDYSEKESMLHTIFEKSNLSGTELFALNLNIAIQLLSSFDGKIIYPENESQEKVFEKATVKISTDSGELQNNILENNKNCIIPNGTYFLKRKSKKENKIINASAKVENDNFTILKGSILASIESAGCSGPAKKAREAAKIDESGKLLEDFNLGKCSPSLAGSFVIFASIDGWREWINIDGMSIDIYRKGK